MFKVRVVSNKLSDGSRTYDVLMSDDDGNTLEFHAYGPEQAHNLAGELAGSVQHYTCDVAEVVDLTSSEVV
jgi:hypothetical protein